jgi:hypothetical protein
MAPSAKLSYDFVKGGSKMRRFLAIATMISLLTGWLLSAPVVSPAYQRLSATAVTPDSLYTRLDQTDYSKMALGGLKAMPRLTGLSEEQRKYLQSLQDETGAIAQTPEQTHTVPYFSNMAALAMLSYRDGRAAVRNYLEWYLQHINSKDRFGLAGTIYDYVWTEAGWQPTNNYDSADSYAATFLSLVLAYSKASGDLSFARQHGDELTTVANVLLTLQDKDGLMWAKPRYYVKFLMDNAENYRGLLDAAELMQLLGRDQQANSYALAATKVAIGIEQRLWIPKRQAYAWALYGRWWARQPVDRWYPDTISQVYPIVFGLVPADGLRAKTLYAYLNQSYPNWVEGEFDDRFPWTILALVAATMQDKQRAVAYLDNVNQQMFTSGQDPDYPWYAGESAFLVQAWQLLKLEVPAFADVQSGDATQEADALSEVGPSPDQADSNQKAQSETSK